MDSWTSIICMGREVKICVVDTGIFRSSVGDMTQKSDYYGLYSPVLGIITLSDELTSDNFWQILCHELTHFMLSSVRVSEDLSHEDVATLSEFWGDIFPQLCSLRPSFSAEGRLQGFEKKLDLCI